MSVTITCNVQDAIAYVKRDAYGSIDYHKKDMAEQVKKVKRNAYTLAKLAMVLPPEADLDVSGPWQLKYPMVKFDQSALAKVWAAVGKMKPQEKDLVDADKRLIGVTLSSDRYPGVKFYYERPLPEGSKCKIVEETRTYKTLACSVE